MPVFIFKATEAALRSGSYPNGPSDWSGATFFVTLVKSQPATTATKVDQLNRSTDPSFVDQPVTILTGDPGTLEFRSQVEFPAINSAETFIGYVIYERAGATLNPALDRPYIFNSWIDYEAKFPALPIPLDEPLQIDLRFYGALAISSAGFIFNSGAIDTTSGNTIRNSNNGILGIVGVALGISLGDTFAAPLFAGVFTTLITVSGIFIEEMRDKNVSVVRSNTVPVRYAIRLNSRKMYPTEMILNYNNIAATAGTINIYTIPNVAMNNAAVNSADWILIGTFTTPAAVESDAVVRIPLNSSNYFSFLCIEVLSNNIAIIEMDFIGKFHSPVNSIL